VGEKSPTFFGKYRVFEIVLLQYLEINEVEMEKVNLDEKFCKIHEYWKPFVVG